MELLLWMGLTEGSPHLIMSPREAVAGVALVVIPDVPVSTPRRWVGLVVEAVRATIKAQRQRDRQSVMVSIPSTTLAEYAQVPLGGAVQVVAALALPVMKGPRIWPRIPTRRQKAA